MAENEGANPLQVQSPDQNQSVQKAPGEENVPKALQGNVDVHMKITSVAELKEKAPEVYKETLKALAQDVMRAMEKHQERYREAMKKARYNQ